MDTVNWMDNLGNRIKDRDLRQLLIPGTHDSGSFSADMILAVRTQNNGFADQLEKGIRFFDLRVTDSGNPPTLGFEKDTFYLCHNYISATNLQLEPQLQAINTFASAHPKEIVLLEFHRLLSGIYARAPDPAPGMSAEAKTRLAKLIKNIFGDKLIPSGANTIIGDIWASGKNIIVFFPGGEGGLWSTDHIETWWDEYSSDPNHTLEEKIPHLWNYLDLNLQTEPSGKFNNAAATIWTLDIKSSAGILNPQVGAWVFEWYKNKNPKRTLNVVTIDYFENIDFPTLILGLLNEE